MNSSAKAPLAVNACSTASLIRSQVSGSPSSIRLPFWRSAARSSSRAASIAASAARWARRIPAISASFFTRRRRTNCSRSAVTSIPLARRWSATNSGKVDGTAARSIPKRRVARRIDLELDLLAREPLRVELVDPDSS